MEKLMPKKKHNTNRSIMGIIYFMLACFAGLIIYVIWFMVADANEVINNPYNRRQKILEDHNVRGELLSSDGTTVLARTVLDDEGVERREYPQGRAFAHVVGYIGNGGMGLENDAAYYLLKSDQNIFERLGNDLSGTKNMGNRVITTLDAGLSRKIYEAMGDQQGAVVVLEPSTGKILAMVSKPDFDPNTIDKEYSTIIQDANSSVLYNRATQGLYPPGSTFKIVTMLAYLREHEDALQKYSYDCTGSITVENEVMNCRDGMVHGKENLFDSFANSCNTSFVNMGTSLDYAAFRECAEDFLFNKELPLNIKYNRSRFPIDENSSAWEVAQSSFGQGELGITPIHLAMIGAAIANEGVLMKPYLIDRVENSNGVTLHQFAKQKAHTMMSKDEASILKDAMAHMVTVSLDWLYGDCGYSVAAKTGTAQYSSQDKYHSLFVSFSPVENPKLAIGVVLEGNTRYEAASELTKKIYDYYYSRN